MLTVSFMQFKTSHYSLTTTEEGSVVSFHIVCVCVCVYVYMMKHISRFKSFLQSHIFCVFSINMGFQSTIKSNIYTCNMFKYEKAA